MSTATRGLTSASAINISNIAPQRVFIEGKNYLEYSAQQGSDNNIPEKLSMLFRKFPYMSSEAPEKQPRLALASYVSGQLYKTRKEYSVPTVFDLSVGNEHVPVYSMRGAPKASFNNIPESFVSYKCIQLFAASALNNYVEQLYSDKDVWLMTPLARVQISDANINGLAERLGLPPSSVVKQFNSSTATGSFYLGDSNVNFSAASLIANWGNAVGPGKNAAMAALQKELRGYASKGENFDKNTVQLILSHMGNKMSIDTEEISSMLARAAASSLRRFTAPPRPGDSLEAAKGTPRGVELGSVIRKPVDSDA